MISVITLVTNTKILSKIPFTKMMFTNKKEKTKLLIVILFKGTLLVLLVMNNKKIPNNRLNKSNKKAAFNFKSTSPLKMMNVTIKNLL